MDKRPNTVRTSKKMQATDKAEITCKHDQRVLRSNCFTPNLPEAMHVRCSATHLDQQQDSADW